MKKTYFIALSFLMITWASAAQQLSFQKQLELMDQKKLEGKATGKEQLVNPDAPKSITRVSSPTNPGNSTTSACNCWIPRDATWLIAPMDGSGASGGPGVAPLYRNDDWSTPLINLPFNLCFYGQSVNQIYINNNGNISIGAPYSTFTANSFPDPSYVMIAPFWGDVDTRGATSGLVYYKVTPTYLIVQWENVGYFPSAVDKLNTFQLIVTDGNDPILGPGNNVSFCYQDMQWTTGGASGGVGGFGGTPATVGVNQGNGVDYIQFGLFDQAGGAYDGPFGSNDGIDWLDNQNFTFSFCTSGANIPPVLNTLNVCDTIFVCQGQTVNYTANYYAPEMGQVTNITLNPGTMSGINVISNTPGNTASIDFSITGVTPGIFSFQIQATDDGIPAGVTTNTIVVRVYPTPTANASFLPASPVQTNTAVQFTNLSSPGSLLTWNFGDGSPTSSLPNPSHTYTAPGTYTVTLTAMFPNGCSTTWTSSIVVQSCATSPFTTTNVCQGNPTTITYTGVAGPSAVFNWNFAGATVLSGSGRGPYSVQWNTPGSYNVSLNVVDGGCTSTTTTVAATVYQNPVASISSIPNLCVGATTNASFTGTAGSGATYNWNFGIATVNSGSGAGPYNLQWNTPGNYTVALTVSENGCTNSTTVNTTVNAIPTANFTATPSACANSPVSINYTGSATAGASYNWNFNGATINSGSGQGPYSISFANGGAYNVTLTVTENGCTSTPVNQPVSITNNPVAAITATPSLCINASNGITYSGTSIAGAIYTWNFDNGTVASGSGAGPYSVSWPTAGNYNVTVGVNQNGCTSSASFPVTVNAIPTSNFTLPAAVCANNPVNVNYTGSASGTATYNWTFTGATINSGTGAGPYSVSYSAGGSYNVTLTVTENGCTSTPSQSAITVTDNPAAAISSTPALCVNAANAINYSGTSVAGASYTWNFDSGTVASGSGSGPYSVSWSTPGNYNVTVSVNQNGCTSTANVPVTVYAIPTSNFTATPAACANAPVNITYTGTASAGATYNWNFGGGAGGGTGAGPHQLTFASGGSYTVSLTVSENGCVGLPIQLPVAITDNPVAAISSTPSLCVNDNNTINFSGTALSAAVFNWNFGGGTVASGSGSGPYNVSWSTPGNYSVSVSVEQSGCTAQTTVPVTVNYIPTADFTVTPAVCVGDPVLVNYTGIGTGSSNYQWNFNGGTINSGSAAGPYSIQFTSTGTNQISLVVSENGCTSTVNIQSTNINPIPAVDAGVNASVCSGTTVNVGALSPLSGATYSWTPSTGVADPSQAQTTITPVNSTTANQQITYTLNVIDANGCINSDQVTVEAFPLPVVNFITPSDQCLENNNFTFSAISNLPIGINYSWTFAGGTPSSSSNVTENVSYTAVGSYPVVLSAEYNGCVSPVYTDVVNVREMPITDFIPQVFDGCQPLTVPFSNLSSGTGNSYSWAFYDGSSGDTASNPVHVFNSPGIYSVTLTSTNTYGCRTDSTLRNVIVVYPEAVARFTPNPAVANILSPAIQFQNYSNNAVTYSWTFGDGDTSLQRSPSHAYADTGSYEVTLVVVSPDGCIDSIAGIVRVEDNFAFYIPNAFTPNGDGVNDTFRGFGVAMRSYSMSIYNRWGELIYRTNDYNQAWDGKVQDVVQNDVYVYRIEVVDNRDEKHIYLGNVSVVR